MSYYPQFPRKWPLWAVTTQKYADDRGEGAHDRSMLFLKPPNTLSTHGNTVTLPAGKKQVDWEAEVGIIIDNQCRHIDEDEAMGMARASPA